MVTVKTYLVQDMMLSSFAAPGSNMTVERRASRHDILKMNSRIDLRRLPSSSQDATIRNILKKW